MRNFIYPALLASLVLFGCSSDDTSNVVNSAEVISLSINSEAPMLYNQNITAKIETLQDGTEYISISAEGPEIEAGITNSFYIRNYSTDHNTYYSPEYNPNGDYDQVMYFVSNQGSDNVGWQGEITYQVSEVPEIGEYFDITFSGAVQQNVVNGHIHVLRDE
ncbi:hypothetical protein HUK80_01140 [Flavobacterium sp. MAH-1]|uniref:Uncharacterized protein n=1 Tax=Flavobacterium agri TaxID=2743471 RepID=A0A7Y8XYZ1_9FLAO|nr:hypothetical protein [Flavobacterium agri]NUY79484.1 hypothetical protein [Flavobacterium agri]NYA69509.1 hypothetical protein [Flavobacterium agri]